MMNQKQIGRYIAEKRRIKNLTQAQLAEQLGISDKTVSKWECGRSMPDYALIQSLCETLDISVSELIEGKEASLHERQMMELGYGAPKNWKDKTASCMVSSCSYSALPCRPLHRISLARRCRICSPASSWVYLSVSFSSAYI